MRIVLAALCALASFQVAARTSLAAQTAESFAENIPYGIMLEKWHASRSLHQTLRAESRLPKAVDFAETAPSAEQRAREFAAFAAEMRQLEQLPPPESQSFSVPSRISEPVARWSVDPGGGVEPASFAKSYAEGPDGMVIPWNGEIRFQRNDIHCAGRGEIDFTFIRYYRSRIDYEGPLGSGWDHNHNVRLLISDGVMGEVSTANSLVFHTGETAIIFSRDDEEWRAAPGYFLSLQISTDGDRAEIVTPTLTRYVFTRLVESPEKGWRLAEIASRHDVGRANRLVYEYMPGSDVLESVTDVWGTKFYFLYNEDGTLKRVASDEYAVEFTYDRRLRLTKACIPRVARGFSRRTDAGETYEYGSFFTRDWLARIMIIGSESSLAINYDKREESETAGHVEGIVVSGGGLEKKWTFARKASTVRVTRPAPEPAIIYEYNATDAAGLPIALRRVADGATWRFRYNQDGLLTERTHPEGWRFVYDFDSENPDPKRRGDRLSEQIISAESVEGGLRSTGFRTQYHSDISLPIRREYFEIGVDGAESVLAIDSWEYEGQDYLNRATTELGIRTAIVQNRFGETVLRRVGSGGVDIYLRACNPNDLRGAADGEGRIVREILDAGPSETLDALDAVATDRNGEFLPAVDTLRPPPVAMETLRVWNERGEVVEERTGRTISLIHRNRIGLTLASYANDTGLAVHEYNEAMQWMRTWRPFVVADADVHHGTALQSFAGRFFIERCERDALGRITRWSPTDEPGGTSRRIPWHRFERYPGGAVHAIVNPAGIARVDEYDTDTGELSSVSIRSAEGRKVILQSGLIHSPSGHLLRYRDNTGAEWRRQLDGMGRIASTARPDGTVEAVWYDGLERPKRKTLSLNSRVLFEEITEYGPGDNVTRRMVRDPELGTETIEYEAVVDDCGRLSATRGARIDSWIHHLFDGLSRPVASVDASGEVSTIVYYEGLPAIEGRHRSKERETVPEVTHQATVYDDRGFPVAVAFVDGAGRIVPERGEWSVHDESGRLTARRIGERAIQRKRYDTLGRIRRDSTEPLRHEYGEENLLTEMEYGLDGQPVATILHNRPLALYADGKHSRLDVPQIRKWEYDEFGRLLRETDPDGLARSRQYGDDSLPRKIVWNAIGEDAPALSLGIEYDAMQRVRRILDEQDRQLRSLEFDAFGRCIRAVEGEEPKAVVVERNYDVRGELTREKTILDGVALPELYRVVDPGAGRMSIGWRDGMRREDDGWWNLETREWDSAGRLAALKLDNEPFAIWRYTGSLITRKEIPALSWRQRFSYTEAGDLGESSLFCGSGKDAVEQANFQYVYEPSGVVAISGRRFSGDTETRVREDWYYSQNDSLDRLVAYGHDAFAPENPQRRRRERLGIGDAARMLPVERKRYDQAGNIWLRIIGPDRQLGDNSPPTIHEWSSSASPIATQKHRTPQEMAALASNRLAVKVSPMPNSANMTDSARIGTITSEYHYDAMGRLRQWRGRYWDGRTSHPVEWEMSYSSLGRLERMEAKAVGDETAKDSTSAASTAILAFRYDSFGRRVVKAVWNGDGKDEPVTRQAFLYDPAHNPALQLRWEDGSWRPTEKYLWGGGEKELLLGCRPEKEVLGYGGAIPKRFYCLQNREYDVVGIARVSAGEFGWLSRTHYLPFGEEDTEADIQRATGLTSAIDKAWALADGRIDDGQDASWDIVAGTRGFLVLELRTEHEIKALTLWTGQDFPTSFDAFILPRGVKLPESEAYEDWKKDAERKGWGGECARSQIYPAVSGGFALKSDLLFDPYRLWLGGLTGDRVVLSWREDSARTVRIREATLHIGTNRNGGFGFAGQWLDRETGLYCHGQRYYLPELSGKFISPDPLGFMDGGNLYAYAHNNPLSWHDPDGQFAHVFVGAGIGSVFGGGLYALNTWWTGEEFSWRELVYQTAFGAATGAATSLTMGLGGSFILSGAVGGGMAGGLGGWHDGGDLRDIGTGVLKGGVLGVVGGFIGGKTIGLMGISKNLLGNGVVRGVATSMVTGTATGGAVGAVGGLWQGVSEYGLSTEALSMAGRGLVKGATFGAIGGLAGYGVGKLGDSIAGKSWTQAKREYWKTEADKRSGDYSAENLELMARGRAPRRPFNPLNGKINEPMELHHMLFPQRSGLPHVFVNARFNLKPVWPEQHAAVDPFRHYR